MEEKNFGDFDVVEETEIVTEEQQPGMPPQRVKMPREGELIGIIVQRFGGNKMEVMSTDGKSRNCRVPGRFKRTMWLKPKDVVIIKPWADDDSKADVIYKYNSSSINQLRKKGILNSIKIEF